MAPTKLSLALLDVCDELLLHIFAFLEIPELLACSRVGSHPHHSHPHPALSLPYHLNTN